MSELREIVEKFLPKNFGWQKELIKEMENLITEWHIRKRKKWAMGLLPKEESIDNVNPGNLTLIAQIRGKNQCRAEILKRIEEE